jgi:hypothetical protein
MKHDVKTGIMLAMMARPNEELTVTEVAKQMNRMDIFVPYTMAAHIVQLWSTGKLSRPKRGVYLYVPPEEQEEMPVFKGTRESLNKITLF